MLITDTFQLQRSSQPMSQHRQKGWLKGLIDELNRKIMEDCSSNLTVLFLVCLGAAVKSSSDKRWYPVMIRWCLYLCHKLGTKPCVSLDVFLSPLSELFAIILTSFSDDVDEQLMDAADVSNLQECDYGRKRRSCLQQAFWSSSRFYESWQH